MIDLTQTTFMIPLLIDSEDRYLNFKFVIDYICKNLKTNIIIYQVYYTDNYEREKYNISHIYNELVTKYFFPNHYNNSKPPQWRIISIPINTREHPELRYFHRTQHLNKMLSIVKYDYRTPVVVNYDIDIFIDPEFYLIAQNKILNENYDLVYPYFKGESQMRITPQGRAKLLEGKILDRDIIDGKNDNYLLKEDWFFWRSEAGHCQFVKTDSYFSAGMENENLISWAPEDHERMNRFITLGYKVMWMNNYIYHLEHSRGKDSSEDNPFYKSNRELVNKLEAMSADDLRNYYNSQEYLKLYK